jgi:hypothetical protein
MTDTQRDPTEGRSFRMQHRHQRGINPGTHSGANAALTLVATCWSCHEPQLKQVVATPDPQASFAWSCTRCDVSWTGTGSAASALAF